MNLHKLEDQFFIFASNMENPESFFQGYCFSECDYIFGDGGAKDFYKAKGFNIKGGEDGCYVTVESQHNVFSFSSDFSGNKKIFYYWMPNLWVVSNSLFLLAEHLKKSNVILTANYSQLAAIGIHKGGFFNQLYSVNTFIDGVRLLPTESSLSISKSGYSIQSIKKETVFKNYEEGLSVFIGMWIARLTGLLNSGIEVRSDLTGGADSRTVFTFLKKAAEESVEKENRPLLHSSSTPNNTTDLKIAEKIGEAYGLSINEKGVPTTNRFSGADSFFSWKILCLGTYHPIYFPKSGPQFNRVGLGGAGAENHRPFYKYEDIETWMNINASKVSPSWLSHNVVAEVNSEINRMTSTGSKIDPMILHYRAYRNRMHSGRTPQYVALFNPLGSKILEDISEIAGNHRLEAGQINYDLMATLLPSILNIPFDSDAKALNEVRVKNLTQLKEWHKFKPGVCYIESLVKEYPKEKTLSALELLNSDFQRSKDKSFVRSFFGESFINQAEEMIENAVENKRFSHAVDGQGVAAILAASIFD
ncbi:hypothetical protein [Psychrobacter alimentarius]|uniref:hypothetical protein n=1 Tax=Psychrobacter alimentarius TaxID=261164 RepID=UPI003FD3A889